MKQQIVESVKNIISDRGLLSVLAFFVFSCIALLIYLGININPSDLQVVVHYTSYGLTNFYRDKWYYLLGFAAFIVIHAIVHIALTAKILQEKGRDLSMAFAWLGILIVFITSITLFQVLRIASLT